jgi:hypothetical protein
VLTSSYAGQISLTTAGAYLSACTSGTAVAGIPSTLTLAALTNLGTIGENGVSFATGGTIVNAGGC